MMEDHPTLLELQYRFRRRDDLAEAARRTLVHEATVEHDPPPVSIPRIVVRRFLHLMRIQPITQG